MRPALTPLPAKAFLGEEILSKVSIGLQNADPAAFDALVTLIDEAPRVFVTGAGRSGLAGRMFAMRLMHLGKSVFVAGEATTPRLREGDLLVVLSGSGNTEPILHGVRTAKACGATVAGLSQKQDGKPNALKEIGDLVVLLERRSAPRKREPSLVSIPTATRCNRTPLGTTFELCALIYLEAVVAELISRNQIREGVLADHHANLE